MPSKKREPGGYSLGDEASHKVALRVRELLKSTGLTQKDLSAETAIPEAHLSNLLSLKSPRHRNFQGWQVHRIGEAFGLADAYVLGPEFAALGSTKGTKRRTGLVELLQLDANLKYGKGEDRRWRELCRAVIQRIGNDLMPHEKQALEDGRPPLLQKVAFVDEQYIEDLIRIRREAMDRAVDRIERAIPLDVDPEADDLEQVLKKAKK